MRESGCQWLPKIISTVTAYVVVEMIHEVFVDTDTESQGELQHLQMPINT